MTKTHEQFLNDIKFKNDKVEIIGVYTGATNYIKAKCKQCSYEWEAKAYSLLSGRACPKCKTARGIENNKGKTKKKTHEEFVTELLKINNSIEITSKYISHHNTIKCKCTRCYYEWEAMAYSLLQGHGCPRCAKSGTSFMEQFIRLSYINTLSEKEVLSRDRKTIGMELDIYIPKLKIAIEPGNWYLHKKSIKIDIKKRKLCSKKGIRLITIYDKFPINEKIPFTNDCFVFNDDYNKSNHNEIKKLVLQLFRISKLDCNFSDEIWNQIEHEAYKNAKARTHESFVVEMKKVNNNIEVIGKYTNANRRLLVKCKICGYKWYGIPASLLRDDGCRKCGVIESHKKFLKKDDVVVNELLIKNPNVEVISNYNGRHNPIKIKCKICGYVWEPIVSSLLRGSSHKNAKSMHKK